VTSDHVSTKVVMFIYFTRKRHHQQQQASLRKHLTLTYKISNSNRLFSQPRTSLKKRFSCDRSLRMFESRDCRGLPEGRRQASGAWAIWLSMQATCPKNVRRRWRMMSERGASDVGHRRFCWKWSHAIEFLIRYRFRFIANEYSVVYWGGYTRVYAVHQPPGFFRQRILTSVIINKQDILYTRMPRPFAYTHLHV